MVLDLVRSLGNRRVVVCQSMERVGLGSHGPITHRGQCRQCPAPLVMGRRLDLWQVEVELLLRCLGLDAWKCSMSC